MFCSHGSKDGLINSTARSIRVIRTNAYKLSGKYSLLGERLVTMPHGETTRDWTDGVGSRLLKFIEFSESGCWLWCGYCHHGYGIISFNGKPRKAHRVAYCEWIGPIPADLTLDHLCRTRNCVNPFHLEPVTQRENVLRGDSPVAKHAKKTHCSKGHPYDLENTYITRNGGRLCRECRRQQDLKHYYTMSVEGYAAYRIRENRRSKEYQERKRKENQ